MSDQVEEFLVALDAEISRIEKAEDDRRRRLGWPAVDELDPVSEFWIHMLVWLLNWSQA